jgi:hypothetical protein
METVTRDSFLFLEPKLPDPEEEPLTSSQSSSGSRAIDMTASKSSQRYHISSHPHYVTTSQELRAIVDRTLIPKEVFPLLPNTPSQLQHVDRV